MADVHGAQPAGSWDRTAGKTQPDAIERVGRVADAAVPGAATDRAAAPTAAAGHPTRACGGTLWIVYGGDRIIPMPVGTPFPHIAMAIDFPVVAALLAVAYEDVAKLFAAFACM